MHPFPLVLGCSLKNQLGVNGAKTNNNPFNKSDLVQIFKIHLKFISCFICSQWIILQYTKNSISWSFLVFNWCCCTWCILHILTFQHICMNKPVKLLEHLIFKIVVWLMIFWLISWVPLYCYVCFNLYIFQIYF